MPSTAFALTVGTLTFFVAVLLGPPLIRGLRLWTIGETTLLVPADDSGSAGDRRFVPIMGGLMVIIPVAVVIITLNVVGLFDPDLTGRSILLPVLVMLTFCAIGMLDDWETMRSIRVEALSARQRLGMQFVLAIATALVLYFLFDIRSLVLPGVEQRIDLGLRYIPVAVVIVFAMSNAMDLTDGVDGLAGIVSVTCFASYGIVALVQEQVFLTQFCMTMVGALVGFLWFNIYPAQLRLCDTGSFALWSTLGVVALMTG
ncbi:MAG: phospho-N-acetylmuramoyl-pentapeptide-transferase, partial [Anaerolineae bacterium]